MRAIFFGEVTVGQEIAIAATDTSPFQIERSYSKHVRQVHFVHKGFSSAEQVQEHSDGVSVDGSLTGRINGCSHATGQVGL